MQKGRLRATADQRQLVVNWRMLADIVARKYDEALRRYARGRLLDLGCGAAPLYAAYRDHIDSVTCVDWTNTPYGVSYLDLECDLSHPLPLETGSFDTIILSDVLEHLPEPATCWAEVSRLLAPGGKFILNVPFWCRVHQAPHDYYRYTQFALARFAEKADLRVLQLDPAGGAVECVLDMVGGILDKAKLKPLSLAVQHVGMWFYGTSLGQRLVASTGQTMPLGWFMVVEKP
jgi:SAM-dependent methyltransferase